MWSCGHVTQAAIIELLIVWNRQVTWVYVSGPCLDMRWGCAPLNIYRVSCSRPCLDRARDQSTGWRELERGERVGNIGTAFCAILLSDFWTSSAKKVKIVSLQSIAKVAFYSNLNDVSDYTTTSAIRGDELLISWILPIAKSFMPVTISPAQKSLEDAR